MNAKTVLAPVAITLTTETEQLATEWLDCKDTELLGNKARRYRKELGQTLDGILNEGDVIVLNRGGFKRYAWTRTHVEGRTDWEAIARALAGKHGEDLTEFTATHKTADYTKLELKAERK